MVAVQSGIILFCHAVCDLGHMTITALNLTRLPSKTVQRAYLGVVA